MTYQDIFLLVAIISTGLFAITFYYCRVFYKEAKKQAKDYDVAVAMMLELIADPTLYKRVRNDISATKETYKRIARELDV